MSISQKWQRRMRGLLAASVLALPVAIHGGITAFAGTDQPAPMVTGGSAGATGAALFSSPLSGPMRTLRLSTLDLPRPVGTSAGTPAIDTLATTENSSAIAALPPPSVFLASRPALPPGLTLADDAPNALMGLAFDLVLELPVITADGADLAATYAALAERLGGTLPYGSAAFFAADDHQALGLSSDMPELEDEMVWEEAAGASATIMDAEAVSTTPMQQSGLPATAAVLTSGTASAPSLAVKAMDAPIAEPPLPALHHDPVAIFSTHPDVFPPLAFTYDGLAHQGLVPLPLPRPAEMPELAATPAHVDAPGGIWPSPARRLGLKGAVLSKARKCLAEAIYFESRGEPRRGQVAVAQVVVNRVFSGYYPADICGAVYQNAHRKLACQFTFACDDVKDVVREPAMWTQANEIAADMLDGKLWLSSVGRATHYHASWVNPSWVSEMQMLDRIGVHTFYRPRNWNG